VPSGQGNITKLAEDSLASIRRAAGLIKENITLDETGSTIEHIKNTFKPEIEKFERTGNLDKHLFKALFDYYEDVMPYGAKTAEDLDPYEWVGDRLTHELGLTKSNLSPWEKFKLRNDDARSEAGLEPNDWSKHPDFDESVMHGDYAEEAKDPMTQQSDPAGTAQPAYPEYADPLTDILKTAGVAPQNTPAPDYETGELDEGPIGAVAGEILAPELGPLAPIIGSAVGDKISDAFNDEEVDETDDSAQQIASAQADLDAQSNASAQQLATAQANAPKGPLFYPTPDAGHQDFRDPANAWRYPGNAPGTGGVKDMGSVVPANSNSLPKPAGGGASGAAMDLPKGMLGGPNTPVNEKESPLAGQYGHSGKMKEVGKETSFLDRLKELSGMVRN
jgi:hypothetical protein